MYHPTIFFSDFDERAFQPYLFEELFPTLLCYILLGESVLFHPMYAWHSQGARELFLNPRNDNLLKEVNIKFILADNELIKDYVYNRLDKLYAVTNRNYPLTELARYESYGIKKIEKDVALLDGKFLTVNSRYRLPNKDLRFRQLILRELEDEMSTLSRLLPPERITYSSLKKDLIGYVKSSSNLVSCDTVLQIFRQYFYSDKELDLVDRHLHALMVGSHSDGVVHVPQKNILRPGTRIDPYNPAVFWSVMARLIGENSMRKFWSMPPAELVTLANALKKDKTWNDFILDYIAVVSEFSTELCEHEKKVFEKLEKDRYPHPYYNFNRFIAAINFVFLTNTIFFSSAFREAVAAKYLSYTFSAWGFYWLIKDSVNGYLNSRRRMLSVNLLNLMNKS